MSVESQADVIHSHQLNYKPVHEANPKYRTMRIPLNNLTGSTTTLTATETRLLEFKMPNCVYNLAQSYIGYSIAIPTSGAPNANWVQEDSFEICSQIYFGNASGMDLCNLNNVSRYVKVARKIKTKFNDFITNDSTSGLYPSNVQASANYYPVAGQNSGNTLTGVINYIEPAYLSATALNGVVAKDRLFKLGDIPETIFANDKDIYIPTDMYLRVTAGPVNNFAFYSTAIDNPSTGASALAVTTTLNNIYLYLSVETNDLIIQSVMSKVLTSGLSLNIPYTTSFRNSSTGVVANVNIPLSSQYGSKLKQILTLVYNGTDSTNTTQDNGDYNGTKLLTYNTFVNNRQLQDNKISCSAGTNGIVANWDDYRENSKYIKGSVIQNKAMYAQNWFHLDRFFEENKSTLIDEYNRQDGLDMSQPILWQLQATTANGTWAYYNYATFNRNVVFDKSGFQIVV